MIDRRGVIVGAAALATAGEALAQGPADFTYDYLFVTLKPQTRAGFMTHLTSVVRPAVTAAGGALIGVFNAQLGWDSNELAVMIRWPTNAKDRDKALAAVQAAPQLAKLERHGLAPTVRPRAQDQLTPGGIYVHRWFEIKASDREEFVRLSVEGWADFEKKFDAKIFGLLTEAAGANIRLLLLTRYGSHGVWEASRDPTTEGMKSFQRRAQLTIASRGCSTLLAAIPG